MTAPPLARSTLDRAAHRRTDPAWLEQAWQRCRVVLVDVVRGGRALVRDTGDGDADPVELVYLDPAAAGSPDPDERLFLGVDSDDVPVFAVAAPLPQFPSTRAANLRDVGDRLSDTDAGIFTTALALAHWHARSPYSPSSGQLTVAAEGGWVRLEETGGQHWPRTDPAVIVLVHDGEPGPDGRCLLGHNAAWSGTGWTGRRFSCLAGFVEAGESAEAAVVREVFEEVGVRVSRITYVASQAWPFPGSLMLGFTAYADPRQPVRTDPEEISEARWFSRREIATVLAGDGTPVGLGDGVLIGLPMAASIAHHLISGWLRAG